MVTLSKVRYKNFLAAGDVPIEIPLDAHQSTLIVGQNGAGKSTLTEAIAFGWFGRSLRNITKPSLVNSTNKREAMVEVWFRVQQTDYYVKRGIKPNVFEIHQDGVLIPTPAALADYQTLLETSILGFNFRSFMQIVILGSASYVPFMRLNPAARREIIESLLDIEIFSVMSGLAKDELSDTKHNTDKIVQQKTLVGEQLRMAEGFAEQLNDERDAKLALVRESLGRVVEQMAELQTEANSYQDELDAYAHAQDDFDAASQKLTGYDRTYQSLEKQHQKLIKEREFYTANDTCPTCQQTITEAFKMDRYTLIATKEAAAKKALDQCLVLLEKYEAARTLHQADLRVAATIRKKIDGIHAQLPVHKSRAKELQRELDAPEPVAPPVVDAEDLRQKIADLQEQHDTLAKQRAVVETASALLKDSGIKSRVIKHYLPVINKQINFYLTAMDFPVHFVLDETFTEHIQSRHRDDFSYESFSEGEKKRIDLALLLTWRAVAKMKNSAACNLLVLDEVFDSSLDANGTEEFLKIIHTLEHVNVFVISHKTDQLIDRFAHVIMFKKERGFSTLHK